MTGKVKWFDNKKGYGFIISEEGKEVFVHFTGIVKEGFKALNEGQNVEFELSDGDKGVQAVNVVVVAKSEEQVTINKYPQMTKGVSNKFLDAPLLLEVV